MTDFLYDSGTNGLIASLLTLMSTEMNSLTSTSYAGSSVGGSSGVFNQTNTGSAVFADLSFTFGGTITPASPLNISGWFARTLDGSTYEELSALIARPPDFVFAFANSSYASKTVNAPRIALPAVPFKVLVQNNIGGTLPASGNLLKLAPWAVKY